ncbi:hypothetical protein B6I21_07855 [candidate division KSB1 bacterium 4572_119]|nr:MAG: hypothetical protein B6I21_07855 [candidate division KSB1 bacterium 4572_119]
MTRIYVKTLTAMLLLLLILAACNKNKIKPSLPAAERMKAAEKMFKDEDYLDAKTEFRIIILNFPGNTVSAKAQYMYAECHFKLKEYIIAAAEYEKLVRVFPNSEYVDDGQFKIALCYYKLSPKYSLDQEYTLKAIEEFQKFLEDYPTSELKSETNKYMRKCREKLAKKYYVTAESYKKLTYYDAAIIYFDYVLDNYYDTEFSQQALMGKADCYFRMGNNEEAVKYYKIFLDKYPKASRANKVKAELDKILKEG